MFQILLTLACLSGAMKFKPECPNADHPNTVIVTCPVPKECEHKSGPCEATVYDKPTNPPAFKDGKPNTEKPVMRHILSSESPCGCIVYDVVCNCIPNSPKDANGEMVPYKGTCTAAKDGKSSKCVYEIEVKPECRYKPEKQ